MNEIPKETMPINKMGVAPIVGGVNTDWDPAQLPLGGYSKAINVREHGPGFILRPGLFVWDSEGESQNAYLSIFSYTTGWKDAETKYFYVQMANGDIMISDAEPPDEYWGYDFGGMIVFDASSSSDTPLSDAQRTRPGSWSQFREAIVFTGGRSLPLIYPGEDVLPRHVIFIADETNPPPNYVNWGDSVELTEYVTDKEAWSNVNRIYMTWYSDAAIFICCDFPAYRWDFEFDYNSGSNGDVEGYFFDSEDGWVEMTFLGDTTDGFTGDGYISQTQARRRANESSWGHEVPTWNFGYTGYWYAFYPSTYGDGESKMKLCTYSGYDANDEGWDEIQNCPDELDQYAVEVQVEQVSNDNYVYPGDVVEIGGLVAGDYVYMGFTAPPLFLLIDPGTTPNTETDPVVMTVQRPDAGEDGWTNTMGGLVDETDGCKQRGLVHWNPANNNDAAKRSINGSLPMYWLRFKLSVLVTDDALISIKAILYANIREQGQVGYCSTMWKERGCYTFSKYPRDIYVSRKNRPNVLNGSDYAILSPGDGRKNEVTAMLPFYNELMVFQSEDGPQGGCITLFEGYSPETFGKLVLSTRLGTFNAQSVTIVDGTEHTTRTTDVTQTQVAFISKYGVYITDGRTIQQISGPISNYFDQAKDECIVMANDFYAYYSTDSYAIQHWIGYDRQANTLRLGLITQESTRGYPNVFPVYHLNTGNWTFDTYPNHWLTCFGELGAYEGPDTLQFVGASQANGVGSDQYNSLYRCKAGQTWDMDNFDTANGYLGTQVPIEGKLTFEFSNGGNYLEVKEMVLRASEMSTYDLTKKVYENGTLDASETETETMTATGDDLTYRVRMLESIQLNSHFSIEISWSNTTESGEGDDLVEFGPSPILYDVVHEVNTSRNLD